MLLGAATVYIWTLLAAVGFLPHGSARTTNALAYEYSTTITTSTSTTSGATPVTFRSLSARRTARGVLVRWRTASETGTLGFFVVREARGKRARVNARLIPARGAGPYKRLDRLARPGTAYRYWIEVVSRDGTRRLYGSARIAARRPTRAL
jgi:hypothetical protein